MPKRALITYPKLPRTYPGKVVVRIIVTDQPEGEIIAGQEVAFGYGDDETKALDHALATMQETVSLVTEAARARRNELNPKPPYVESTKHRRGLTKCFGFDMNACKKYVNGLWCKECYKDYLEDPDAWK